MEPPNEFLNPSDFGLDLPDGQLKMRLFPVYEAQLAQIGNPLANDLFRKLGIQNIEDSGIFGENFQQMPGIIHIASFGAQPIENLEFLENPVIDYDLYYKEGFTVRAPFLSKYLHPIVSNFVKHVYFYNEIGNEGGINYIFDVTEGTLLSHKWNVHTLIDFLLPLGAAPFSLVEQEIHFEILFNEYTRILNYVKERFGPHDNEPLYMILTHILYATFRRLKHRDNPDWNFFGHDAQYIAPVDWFDYNLRIFFVKRRGRFVHSYERGERKVPLYDGLAPLGELDIGRNIWLAMSQYYRFLPTIQKPFQLNLQFIDIGIVPMFSLRKMISRDAHACASASITATFDSNFFDKCENIAFDHDDGEKDRVIMFGVSSFYKYKRHACLYDGLGTWLFPPAQPYDQSALGILAGICWFFNHTNDNFDESMIDHDILRMPFMPLVLRADEDGMQYKIPNNVPPKDLPKLISPDAIPGFWGYGLDEYILSEFLAKSLRIQALFDDYNMLFFNIAWFQSTFSANGFEFAPLSNHFIFSKKQQYLNERGLFSDSINNFSRNLFEESPNSKKLFLETLFGNILTPNLAILTTASILTNDDRIKAVYNALGAKFNIPEWDDLNWLGRKRVMASLLNQCHRYDRPFYSRSRANKTYQPRIDDNLNPIIPSNRLGMAQLEFALKNKLNRSCVLGPCVQDPEGGPFFNPIEPVALVGGMSHHKRKKRMTRKQKNFKRKSRKARRS